jgi:hypothetical protein
MCRNLGWSLHLNVREVGSTCRYIHMCKCTCTYVHMYDTYVHVHMYIHVHMWKQERTKSRQFLLPAKHTLAVGNFYLFLLHKQCILHMSKTHNSIAMFFPKNLVS